ncbi:hypothetical protein [Clostridium sp. HBUAS56010]|uniref:hypothetical protein n=1 Tax=Clostridium sp. HBUAS56010 TaxID=2571127 RepID=UPI001178AB55|nr:hypothetical protein [Clostridium sp. HBUAS56010]
MIEKSKIINVLNYNENPVCIKTHQKEYICPIGSDSSPSITPLEFSEVESLNSGSPVFKIGTLFLESSDIATEELYKELRILDFNKILKNADIENILTNPSLSGLTQLIEISSVMYFERVRGIFHTLKNSNQYDISTRVEKIINTKYKELCNKQLKTKIILSAKDTVSKVSAEEVGDLKKQNELLQKQMETMQKMMEQMMSMQSSKNTNDEADIEIDDVTEPEDLTPQGKRKAGRPKKDI